MKKNMNENFEITVDEMTEIFGDTPVEMSFREVKEGISFSSSVAVPCHSHRFSINLITFRRKGCWADSTGVSFFGTLPRASATINSPLVIFIFAHSLRLVS